MSIFRRSHKPHRIRVFSFVDFFRLFFVRNMSHEFESLKNQKSKSKISLEWFSRANWTQKFRTVFMGSQFEDSKREVPNHATSNSSTSLENQDDGVSDSERKSRGYQLMYGVTKIWAVVRKLCWFYGFLNFWEITHFDNFISLVIRGHGHGFLVRYVS